MICLPNRDTVFFDIVAVVLYGDTLTPYLSILCLDYILRTSIDLIKMNSHLKRQEADDISQKTMTDTDFVNEQAYLANTPAQGWISNV